MEIAAGEPLRRICAEDQPVLYTVELDLPCSFVQRAGKAYIYEQMKQENPQAFQSKGIVFNQEALFWMRWHYRFWHFYTGESSEDILRQADPKTINVVYLMYHTMAPEMAADRLKETYWKRKE